MTSLEERIRRLEIEYEKLKRLLEKVEWSAGKAAQDVNTVAKEQEDYS